MSQGFSNGNQSVPEAGYSFGEFSLSPRERSLMRSNVPVPIQPKAFDALIALVRRAGRLVSKEELMHDLWPAVHVAEANLTNVVVSLRKTLGAESIQTVSKHGYRFTLPVTGEPGVPRACYERFARAKELTTQRSVESMTLAREMYWTCLAEDPTFASAWAWLGRCCWFLAKFGSSKSSNVELAEASFTRAFGIDPDLAVAHQFYTYILAESGRSEVAIDRLISRLDAHPGEPESFVGLVHVLRFQGLLDLSLEAHKRASELDPTVITSVAHTWFLMGEYQAAIETYRGGRAGYYLDAAAWAALGDTNRAIGLLRERLRTQSLSKLMTTLLSSLLAVLEGRSDDAVRQMSAVDASLDPEILAYFARHYAKAGFRELAISALGKAIGAGFVIAPRPLTSDPWLDSLQPHEGFRSLLAQTQARIEGSPVVLRLSKIFKSAAPISPNLARSRHS